MKQRLSLLQRLIDLWKRVYWFFTGEALKVQLQQTATPAQPASPLRTEAELAVERVVMETDIAADCVCAEIFRGGTAIRVMHNEAWEMFIGRDYNHAAEEAIAWLKRQGDEIKTSKVTHLNRHQRRKFDHERRKKRSH
jgi:hypothetical protein